MPSSGDTPSVASSELASLYESEARQTVLTLVYELIKPGEVSVVETRGENGRLERQVGTTHALRAAAAALSANQHFLNEWRAEVGTDPVAFGKAGTETPLRADFLCHVNDSQLHANDIKARALASEQTVEVLDRGSLSAPASNGVKLVKKLSDADFCPPSATRYVTAEICTNSKLFKRKVLQHERLLLVKTEEFKERHGMPAARAQDVFAFVLFVSPSPPFSKIATYIQKRSAAFPLLAELLACGRVLTLGLVSSLSRTLESVQVQLQRLQRNSGRQEFLLALAAQGKTPAEAAEWLRLCDDIPASP